MAYTKEFLISELHRFKLENDINPKVTDMQIKFGYPATGAYTSQFDSWNNALLAAGLEINQKHHIGTLNGTEICDNCGKLNKVNQNWSYKDNQRLCVACYQKTSKDYKNGNLDSESTVGFGFIGQRVVAKTLGLDLEYDCNCSEGFNHPYDLYDKKLGYINVKARILKNNNSWVFKLIQKEMPDTYILLGFSKDKSNIEHVWVTEPEDDLTFDEKKFKYKQDISITNSEKGLKRAEPWEVDVEPYNDAYHNMSLENCKVLRSD